MSSSSNLSAQKSHHHHHQTQTLLDQIESIKRTLNSSKGDTPEKWIQRQNLQDLFHQIILRSIDVTIDKKLEQDLWNLAFKSQINYFQSQIKLNSQPGGSSGRPSKPSAQNGVPATQKRDEAQASLYFFLEAARGFYTKLLQDIVIRYAADLNLPTGLPFCKRNESLFEKIDLFAQKHRSSSSSSSAKEKQVLYLCQHIITHLGDIARYASLFEQAQNYYMHAIKLVPYLGQPYNQLGILYETTRTHQLATAFYYMRSVAVRYAFPLGATNLENFWRKLADTPLSRYHPSLSGGDSSSSQISANLSHKDLVSLFLQINALICLQASSSAKRAETYVDVFKTSFSSLMQAAPPGQRDKLDGLQLSQMIAILIYTITSSSTSTPPPTDAINLLLFFVEQFVGVYIAQAGPGPISQTVLAGLYLALNFVHTFQDGRLFSELRLCQQTAAAADSEAQAVSFARFMNMMLSITQAASVTSQPDYPINEDRLLEGFTPLAEFHSSLDFKKHMDIGQLRSESEEAEIRVNRIVECVEKMTRKAGDKSFLLLSSARDRFVLNTSVFPEKAEMNRSPAHLQSGDPRLKKKRTNVAIASMTQMGARMSLPTETNRQDSTVSRTSADQFMNNPFDAHRSSDSSFFQSSSNADGFFTDERSGRF